MTAIEQVREEMARRSVSQRKPLHIVFTFVTMCLAVGAFGLFAIALSLV